VVEVFFAVELSKKGVYSDVRCTDYIDPVPPGQRRIRTSGGDVSGLPTTPANHSLQRFCWSALLRNLYLTGCSAHLTWFLESGFG
jgi:hypothetical protein